MTNDKPTTSGIDSEKTAKIAAGAGTLAGLGAYIAAGGLSSVGGTLLCSVAGVPVVGQATALALLVGGLTVLSTKEISECLFNFWMKVFYKKSFSVEP